ncbi:MAG: TetR/AcrR family transcriptional regulator [Albidovulum sp.]|uniref:TetR/AcrR family transcriptional regulator n=1 Tax=Albidovulum sp. TaxID=1872424 RepID=UPI003C97B4E2
MARAVQKRTLETRARLIAAAEEVIAEAGYEAMRVEEVVQRAGVAKGTFFAHFRDKEALLERLIGTRGDAQLDRIEALPPPADIPAIIAALNPLIAEMTSERYVFDLILRYSGAASRAETGPIAQTFARTDEVLSQWLALGPFRKDVTPALLSSGVQAFLMHVTALHFCELYHEQTLQEMLTELLEAWLLPGGTGAKAG